MHFVRVTLLLFACFPAWGQGAQQALPPGLEDAHAQLIQQGMQQVQSGNAQEAIVDYFDKVIEFYESKYRSSQEKVYGARSQAEAAMYIATGALDHQNITILGPVWPNAYYAKAYALIELGRLDESKRFLERAISMSPRNAMYLGELGHIYQTKKQWEEALATFKSAEDAARRFSPPELMTREQSRALRGMGFVLIELNRLDDAEEKFRQCIEFNNQDSVALNELRYIEKLRKDRAASESVGRIDLPRFFGPIVT